MRRKDILPEMQIYASAHSGPQTVARLKALLEDRRIPVFAEFDHAQGAAEVNLPLDFATVVVFGSPAVGTRLMQQNPQIAAVLPLKILVWQAKDGRVYAGFVRLEHIAARYGLAGHPVIDKMKTLMEDLASRAAL